MRLLRRAEELTRNPQDTQTVAVAALVDYDTIAAAVGVADIVAAAVGTMTRMPMAAVVAARADLSCCCC
jgi:hypothetical protein